MYRILRANAELRERQRQAAHPAAVTPGWWPPARTNVGAGVSQNLLGPEKWNYFYLYVVIDIYSGYVVGWMLARQEPAKLAEALLADSVANQGVAPGQLTINADRGTSTASKPVAFLLADLGITKSHNRPHCSNDNPHSEAHFRTLKYRSTFPSRFGSYEDALAFCRRFFAWYNAEHRHSGIGFHTPADVHYGRAESVRAQRAWSSPPPTPLTPNAEDSLTLRAQATHAPGSTRSGVDQQAGGQSPGSVFPREAVS